jgi:hypothetical protein
VSEMAISNDRWEETVRAMHAAVLAAGDDRDAAQAAIAELLPFAVVGALHCTNCAANGIRPVVMVGDTMVSLSGDLATSLLDRVAAGEFGQVTS